MTALRTGVAGRWNRLVGSYNNLAEGVSLTNVGKCGGNLLEPEGAVDLDAHIPRTAQVGKWLKVGWTPFDNEYPDRATGDPPNH